ncbi:crossover junction endonuclease MUS81 isoform X2 [Pogoniulus pusillus]|uniref:crossover junction endonuclease MUS81 isoform X2 n=1 Tax=Pogoniulus pusillus TaxID=488313 RepID=UPI0030B91D66
MAEPAAAAAALRSPGHRRRRRRRPGSDPNPLFTCWLREWRDEAAGTPAARAYERALRSLALYPLPLRSGPAAAILRHFGPKLCLRLQQRLRRHRAEQGLPPSPPPGSETQTGSEAQTGSEVTSTRVCPPRDYRPRPHSRGFALLLALLNSSEPIRAEQLLQLAQPLCDLPLASGALGGLLRRQLVSRSERPPRYSLTPRGRVLALRLAEAALQAPPIRGPILPEAEGSDPPPAAPGPFTLPPGSYDLFLCIDTAEECGGGSRRGLVPALLSRSGQVLRRRLPVGDFLWVAKERSPAPGQAPRELVLDWVVERKTASDLGSSIRDGRYREQKFRLGRCGLRCPIYLLEVPSRGQQLAVPLQVLRQAAVSTQVCDQFLVRWSQSPEHSAAFLRALGEGLKQRYRGRALQAWLGDVTERGSPELPPPGVPCPLLTWDRLREEGAKSQPQTVGEVFARQLLQIGGVSPRVAQGVLSSFPTPARSLGPALGRRLAQLYGTLGPLC